MHSTTTQSTSPTVQTATPATQTVATVAQLAQLERAFTEPALRALIFKSKTNGLDPALIRHGTRVLIDVARFRRWALTGSAA